MKDRRVLTLLLTVALLITGLGLSPTDAQDDCPPMPLIFTPHADYLDAALTSFNTHLDAEGDHLDGAVRFGAELLPANANRGVALLHPATLPATAQYLDALRDLGFMGVKVQVNYPLLEPDFPNADAYLAFYEAVGEMVRERDMRLLVEGGTVFVGTMFSDVTFDTSDLTPQDYFDGMRSMLTQIAETVQPDYLSINSEPTTEATLLGLNIPAPEYIAFIQSTAASLPRPNGMLVGAAAGTWEDEAYFDAFIAMPELDFVNLHMYPVAIPNADLLARALDQSRQAREAGKRVIIGETWLEKVFPQAYIGKYDVEEILSRNVYCFWSPLDSAYLETLAHFAADQDIEMVSFFWSQLFFAYRQSADLTLAPIERQGQDLSRRAYDNAINGVVSPTGATVLDLLTTGGKTRP